MILFLIARDSASSIPIAIHSKQNKTTTKKSSKGSYISKVTERESDRQRDGFCWWWWWRIFRFTLRQLGIHNSIEPKFSIVMKMMIVALWKMNKSCMCVCVCLFGICSSRISISRFFFLVFEVLKTKKNKKEAKLQFD